MDGWLSTHCVMTLDMMRCALCFLLSAVCYQSMRTREEEASSVRILSGMQDTWWFDVCLAVRVLQRQVV